MTQDYMGAWNRTAIQDHCLQIAKRIESRFLANANLETGQEANHFFAQTPALYSNYPKLYPDSHILIFKPDDIGDGIYALPSLVALRKVFPRCRLSLLCQKKTKPIYERSGLFDEIVAVDVQIQFLRFQSFDLQNALNSFSRTDFTAAVFLRSYSAFFNHFKKLDTAQKIHPRDPKLKSDSQFQAHIGLHTSPRQHQWQQMAEILLRVDPRYEIPKTALFPKFNWTEEDKKSIDIVFGKNIPEKFLVVHPFVKYETRRYPIKSWREVLETLHKKTGIPLVIVGGKEDALTGIPNVIEVQGKLSLGQTGYLLEKSSGFLGVESGPGHWAAAMGKPTTMILGGHSLHEEWGPIGNTCVIEKRTPCYGCHKRACPEFKVKCLTEITPKEVLALALPFLGQSG